jgi:hypothetical protein
MMHTLIMARPPFCRFDVSVCPEVSVAEQGEDWSPYLLHGIKRAMTLSENLSIPAFAQASAVLLELARYGNRWCYCFSCPLSMS